MTTIAIRDGVMAATTAVWTSIYRGDSPKIMRTKDGALIATCGDSDMAGPFLAWFEAGADSERIPRIPEKSDFAAIVLLPDESVICFTERFLPMHVSGSFHAMGSGDQLALGAMAHGATAEEAVFVACEFDPWSRAPVQVEFLRR